MPARVPLSRCPQGEAFRSLCSFQLRLARPPSSIDADRPCVFGTLRDAGRSRPSGRLPSFRKVHHGRRGIDKYATILASSSQFWTGATYRLCSRLDDLARIGCTRNSQAGKRPGGGRLA